jgi:hypothetical protein
MAFYREEETEPSLYVTREYEIGDMLLLSFSADAATQKNYAKHITNESKFAFVGIIVDKTYRYNGVPKYDIYFPSTGIVSYKVVLYSGISAELLFTLDEEEHNGENE